MNKHEQMEAIIAQAERFQDENPDEHTAIVILTTERGGVKEGNGILSTLMAGKGSNILESLLALMERDRAFASIVKQAVLSHLAGSILGKK